jgi:two-component system LytT family response regulator
MSTRAVIIEDEPFARQTLREFLSEVDWIELIGEADNGPDAVRLLDRLRPQLVFLDVQIPEFSGLRVLEQIDYEPAVIFTTAHDQYAVRAFEFGAVDYLLKPFGRARFRKTIDRVRSRLESVGESEKLTRLFVRDRERILPLSIDDISRLESSDDYVVVYAKGRRFMVGLTLNEFERRLPADRFRRVHRSHIVNLDLVISIEPFDRRLLLRMSDGSEVLASRAASQLLRDMIA